MAGQNGETIIVCAVVFTILFIIGGIIGGLCFPEFPGRFYVSGLVFGAFGIGAGSLIIKISR